VLSILRCTNSDYLILYLQTLLGVVCIPEQAACLTGVVPYLKSPDNYKTYT